MRIECPSCQAAYDVPDRLLSPGKTVRCARCGGEWVPRAEAPPEPERPRPEPEQAAEQPADMVVAEPEVPRVTAMERLAQQAPRPTSGGKVLRTAWAASFAVLALLFIAAYAARSDVMQAWPPSIRVYSALGLNTH